MLEGLRSFALMRIPIASANDATDQTLVPLCPSFDDRVGRLIDPLLSLSASGDGLTTLGKTAANCRRKFRQGQSPSLFAKCGLLLLLLFLNETRDKRAKQHDGA